ncbi:MAG: helix-turn-helix domain-containing protein [Lachnospiraceae bacterium]|nr:helix-turn-helix domain-containing protein [Lachnospiraceae bacterium]
MYKTITKLTDEQKKDLISEFLTNLGNRIKARRVRRSLSQTELANCLDLDRTTLSKYESGDRDMQVSMLPLISTYCNFPLYELFPRDESQSILDTFAKAVSIVVERKKRQEKMQKIKTEKAKDPA